MSRMADSWFQEREDNVGPKTIHNADTDDTTFDFRVTESSEKENESKEETLSIQKAEELDVAERESVLSSRNYDGVSEAIDDMQRGKQHSTATADDEVPNKHSSDEIYESRSDQHQHNVTPPNEERCYEETVEEGSIDKREEQEEEGGIDDEQLTVQRQVDQIRIYGERQSENGIDNEVSSSNPILTLDNQAATNKEHDSSNQQDAKLDHVLSTRSIETKNSIEVLTSKEADSVDSSEADDKYNVTTEDSNSTESSYSVSEYYTMPSDSPGSNMESNDKYGLLGDVNIIVTQQSGPTSGTSALGSKEHFFREGVLKDDDDNDVVVATGLSNGSTVTDKSIEVSIAPTGSGSLRKAILTLGTDESLDQDDSDKGSHMHEALDNVISSEDTMGEIHSLDRGSSSYEGTYDSSIVEGRTHSYEDGTIESSAFSLYEGTTGTGTMTSFGYDTVGSSVLESYSISSEDNLNLSFFNFGGCIVDPCGTTTPQPSFAPNKREVKKHSDNEGPPEPLQSSEILSERSHSDMYEDTPTSLKKKFEMFTEYMKVEMSLQEHLASAAAAREEEMDKLRPPLSPKSHGSSSRHRNHRGNGSSSNNSFILSDTKTPKHTNRHPNTRDKNIPQVIATNNEDNSEGTGGSSNQENQPKSHHRRRGVVNGGKVGTSNSATTPESLQTGKSWELRNKMLTGARRKMQIAMMHRHLQKTRRPGSYYSHGTPLSSWTGRSSSTTTGVPPQELALVAQSSLRSYSEHNYCPVTDGEQQHHDNTNRTGEQATATVTTEQQLVVGLDSNRFSRNRWKKPSLNMAEYSKRRSRYRRHKRYLRAQTTTTTTTEAVSGTATT